MKTRYSIYEAKTHLSEILRRVREDRTITITDRGREVAQVCPIPAASGFERRVAELEQAGGIVAAVGADPSKIKPIARRPGTLKLFLDDRNRF
jgi:prevent-host-death family protein